MRRAGFSLLELVIVIVTIGIIVSVSMPRFGRNELTLATQQLANHIRYTQHLAMQDDRFDSENIDWFKDRWKISFDSDAYKISSNKTAKNPQDLSKYLSPDSTPELNLKEKYKVKISFNDKCDANGLTFDSLGRPIYLSSSVIARPYINLLDGECKITITKLGEDSKNITIYPETGFVEIN